MNGYSYIKNMRSGRYGRLASHVFFWILFFVTRSYIGFIAINTYPATSSIIYLVSFFNILSTVAVFYPLVYFVWPRLMQRKKYLLSVICITGLIVSYTILDYAGEIVLFQNYNWAAVVRKTNPAYEQYMQQKMFTIVLKRVLTLGIVYQLFVFIAVPLAIKAALAYTRQQVAAAHLAKENLQMEFNFLKSQVNPHFLFNTLNNIYSLILHDKKQQAVDTVARLSDFMRYSLYDAQAEKIQLGIEFRLIGDYIALEKLRLNNAIVNLKLETDDPGYMLPSLLFMPLVENCFKYNEDTVGAFIDITILAVKGHLQLALKNNFNPHFANTSKGGIGINNFKRRLHYYYPDKCNYGFITQGNVYSVQVSINLS